MVSIILVTGFKPYSTFKRNTSGEIAELLNGSYFKGKEVVGTTLEMGHSAIDRVYREEIGKDYEAIINLCLSPGRTSVGIGKLAINWQAGGGDEDGPATKVGKIIENGPDALFSRIPAEETVHSLRSSRIPAEVSYSCGASLCNKIFFYSLYLSKARAGLVLLPVDSDSSLDGKYPTMAIDSLIKSAEIVIQKAI